MLPVRGITSEKVLVTVTSLSEAEHNMLFNLYITTKNILMEFNKGVARVK